MRRQRAAQVVLTNVFINDNFESDVVTIMPSRLWYEYEIKLTRSDFKKDFDKSVRRYGRGTFTDLRKHDLYAGTADWELRNGEQPIMIPRQFSFVCPRGLIAVDEVPAHAGLLEYDDENGKLVPVKRPPLNKAATRLGNHHIWSVAMKLSYKAHSYRHETKKAPSGLE